MKSKEYFIEKITSILASGDANRIQEFTAKLRLIESVENILSHVIELEQLIKLLNSGLSPYIKENYPNEEADTIFCSEIAENTRGNHYKEEADFDINDALDLCGIQRRKFRKLYEYYPKKV